MLVFDGSGSMAEFGYDPRQRTRIDEARVAIARAMPRIAPLRKIGLVVYGPGTGGSCANIDLRFPPIADAADPVIQAIQTLTPGGLTPLAASVLAAAEALNYRQAPGIVVLVTDGNETCGGRPCELGKSLATVAQDLTVHVIGFRNVVDYWTWSNPEQETFGGDDTVARCLADSTGGLYLSTDTIDELSEALQVTLGCPLIGSLGPRRNGQPILPRHTQTRIKPT